MVEERPAPGLARAARMQYWRPHPSLARYVSGYHLYAVDRPAGEMAEDVFFPAWTNLRILLTPDTVWEVRPRGQDWQRIAGPVVFGPSSGLTWSRSDGGVVVGAGLRPAAAWHLLRIGAAKLADRVGPVGLVLRPPTGALVEALMAARDDAAIPRLFDEFLRAAIEPDRVDDARIGAIEAALLDPEVETVPALLKRAGVPLRTLQRLCARAFGLPPRLLLRRARFLRSFDAIRIAGNASGRGVRASLIDASYVDYSHFAKDAQFFFGMSPQNFIALDSPLARQSMALRQEILGAPVQALGTRD